MRPLGPVATREQPAAPFDRRVCGKQWRVKPELELIRDVERVRRTGAVAEPRLQQDAAKRSAAPTTRLPMPSTSM